MKNEAYVFDTSALLAYIENEDGADIIENLILQVLNSEKDSIYISTVSMIETYYKIALNINAIIYGSNSIFHIFLSHKNFESDQICGTYYYNCFIIYVQI